MKIDKIELVLSRELYEALAFIASAKQITLDQLVEDLLRGIPKIKNHIKRFQNLPEDPIIEIEDAGKISSDTPTRIFPKKIQCECGDEYFDDFFSRWNHIIAKHSFR